MPDESHDASAYRRQASVEANRGNLPAAAEALRRAVAIAPDDLELRQTMGATLLDIGQTECAIEELRAVVDRAPAYFEARFNLGLALLRSGQDLDAAAHFAAAAKLQPESYEAHSRLGLAMVHAGKLQDALGAFRAAVSLRPAAADARIDLGAALAQLGRHQEAVVEFQIAVKLAPQSVPAARNLALALFDSERYQEAVPALERALALDPGNPHLHQRLGIALGKLNLHDRAIACFERAVELGLTGPITCANLSAALERAGQFQRAMEVADRGLEASPDDPRLLTRRADLLYGAGRSAEAIEAYRKAIALDPQFATAHLGLAIALLSVGEFGEGFEEYEQRRMVREMRTPIRDFPVPLWNGEACAGRTILLHTEQGFGDAIQFARYLPLVAERGAKVLLECDRALLRLFATIPHVSSVIATGSSLPPFDLHLPLMSLARVMKTQVLTIPNQVPYLHAPAKQREQWQQRLAPQAKALKIGLCRAGRVQDAISRRRAFLAALLSAFAALPNAAFFELTLRDPRRADDPLPPNLALIDHTRLFDDFSETAGFVSALDLVITIDSAIAHLAGALGKETWLLLADVADWRWQQVSGDRSLWYPTMRIFRQRRAGDWAEVLNRVASELRARCAG